MSASWDQGQQQQQPASQGLGGPAGQQQRPPSADGGGGGGGGRGSGKLLIGVALGVVITLVVAAVLLLTKTMTFGSTADAATVDTRPITLPAKLGAVIDRDDVSDAKAPKNADSAKNSANRRAMGSRTYARTAADYKAGYGGAAVAVRSYADSSLLFLPTVIAVRAPSSSLTIGVDPDPKDLGLGGPQQQVERIADVQCLVIDQQTTTAGHTPDPEKLATVACRRSDSSLTVDVVGFGQGSAGQQQLIALTNAAFEVVSTPQP